MKIDTEFLKQTENTYGVVAIQTVPDITKAIESGTSQPIQEPFHTLFEKLGYKWSEDSKCYIKGSQKFYMFPSGILMWTWHDQFARMFNQAPSILKWIKGDSKYPQGKVNVFIKSYTAKVGEPDVDDRTSGGDINFDGTGSRGDVEVPEPSQALAIINKAKAKLKGGFRLPSDEILDLYDQAKTLNGDEKEKAIAFIKTLKPLEENNISTQHLQELVRHIVKVLINEVASKQPIPSPYGPNEQEVDAMAVKLWGDGWRVFNYKNHGSEGEIYQLKNFKEKASRFIAKINGNWMYLNPDPKLRKWMQISLEEESGTGSVSPSNAPLGKDNRICEGDEADAVHDMHADAEAEHYEKNYGSASPRSKKAVSKKSTPVSKKAGVIKIGGKTVDDKQLSEMTTTGAVDGYNVPGAFAKKGGSEKALAGSAALGYTLTSAGEKEMTRQADKLI